MVEYFSINLYGFRCDNCDTMASTPVYYIALFLAAFMLAAYPAIKFIQDSSELSNQKAVVESALRIANTAGNLGEEGSLAEVEIHVPKGCTISTTLGSGDVNVSCKGFTKTVPSKRSFKNSLTISEGNHVVRLEGASDGVTISVS